MTIEELKDKHYMTNNGSDICHLEHTQLSIQFAIEVLDKIFTNGFGMPDIHSTKEDWRREYEDKIQELKQYLDEK